MDNRFDIIIIGGGIAGISIAFHASRRGFKVCLLEKDKIPDGATMRNFGFIWPIGQAGSIDRALALRSREIWNELARKARFAIHNHGAIFPVYSAEGQNLAMEYVESYHEDHSCDWISRHKIPDEFDLLNQNQIHGLLISRTESRINPHEAIRALIKYLKSECGVMINFNEEAIHVSKGCVRTLIREYRAERIFLCTGKDLELYHGLPDFLPFVKICKLHMVGFTSDRKIREFPYCIGSESSMLFYPEFQSLTGYRFLRERISETFPSINRFRLNIMAGITNDNNLIGGDSHEYLNIEEGGINPEIINEINYHLSVVLNLEKFGFKHFRSWTGMYLNHEKQSCYFKDHENGIYSFNGLGGRGMTLSLAVAEKIIEELT